MKKENASLKYKILIVSLSIIFISFAVWNIAWFSFVHIVYQPFIDAIGGYSENGVCTTVSSDNYRYTVFKPSYLSFTSNLSIHENIPLNEENNSCKCSLIIWPKPFGSYQFGVSLSLPEKADNDDNAFSFQSYGYMLDENMKPIESLNSEEKAILEDNKEIISLLYEKAHNMWGIGD